MLSAGAPGLGYPDGGVVPGLSHRACPLEVTGCLVNLDLIYRYRCDMTLILAALTQNFVAIAADRRLSHKVSGEYRAVADDAVKVLDVEGTSLLAYAGIGRVACQHEPKHADVHGVDLSEWAAKILAGTEPHRRMPELAKRFVQLGDQENIFEHYS